MTSQWREHKDVLKFVPTPKQQGILDVLLDPDSRTLSVTQMIEKAGISRQFWYDTLNHSGFKYFYRNAVLEMITMQAGAMVNSSIKEAVKGSHNHFKTLMEMGKLIGPQEQNVTGDIQVKVSFVSADDDDEDQDQD